MDFRALLRALMEQYGQQRQQPGADLAGALGAQPGAELGAAIGQLRPMVEPAALDRQRQYQIAAANFADQTQGMPMDQLQDIFNRRQESAGLAQRYRQRGGRLRDTSYGGM